MTLRPFVMVMEMACSIHPLENPVPILETGMVTVI